MKKVFSQMESSIHMKMTINASTFKIKIKDCKWAKAKIENNVLHSQNFFEEVISQTKTSRLREKQMYSVKHNFLNPQKQNHFNNNKTIELFTSMSKQQEMPH